MYQETLAGHESCECENCIYNRGNESCASMNVLCRAVEVLECDVDLSQGQRTFLVYTHPDEDNYSMKKSPTKNRHGKRGPVDEREKQHACETCGKKFTRKDNLVVHEATHTGEKPYECQLCLKRFTRKGNLITHMSTHSSERHYECQICTKKFTTKDNLARHINTHYGVKSHVCDICSRKFAEKATLTKHMVTHVDVRMHECSVCSKRYKTRATLKKHMRGHDLDKVETEEFRTCESE